MKHFLVFVGLVFLTPCFLLTFPKIANAGYRYNWVSIQHHVYESKSPNNAVVFDLLDDQDNYVTDPSTIKSLKLIDPNENVVNISTVVQDGPMSILPWNFDIGTASWVYQTEWDWTGFWYEILDPMVIGVYKLEVTTIDDEKHEATYDFKYLLDLPIISSRSFQIHSDLNGNIYWMWDIPKELLVIANDRDTHIKAGVGALKNEKIDLLLWSRVPTYMGCLFIPQNIVQQLIDRGDEYVFMLQARTTGDMARSYAKRIVVDDLQAITINKRKSVNIIPMF
jgi:hypothetical protein